MAEPFKIDNWKQLKSRGWNVPEGGVLPPRPKAPPAPPTPKTETTNGNVSKEK